MGDEDNLVLLQRDLALRQAKLAKADLQVTRLALNENRPLEALYTVNNAIDRLDDELGSLEEFEADLKEHLEQERDPPQRDHDEGGNADDR